MSFAEGFDALREDVTELRVAQADLAADVRALHPSVGRIERELFGNGRPGGLIVQVAKLQQQMRVATWLASTIGGAVVVLLTKLAFGV